MIKFTFKQSSCVAIGTFNIYIVQPKLLQEMDVFRAEHPVLLSGDLTQPGFRFEVDNSKWFVRPDRLSVETQDPSVDCGGFVRRTLASLCWTPIMAVGINAIFEAAPGFESMIADELRLPIYPDASQRAVHVSVQHDNTKTNIQLASAEEHLTLSVNRHVDFGHLRNDPKRLSKAVQDVCGSFMEQRDESVEIARKAVRGEMSYERDDIRSGPADD